MYLEYKYNMSKNIDISTWADRSNMRVLIVWPDAWYRWATQEQYNSEKREIDYIYRTEPELNHEWRLSHFLWCTVVFAGTMSRLDQILTDPKHGHFDAIIYIWHLELWKLSDESDLAIPDIPFATAETQRYLSQLLEKSKNIDALKKIFAAKVVLFIDRQFNFPTSDPSVKSILVKNTLDFDEVSDVLEVYLIPVLESSS